MPNRWGVSASMSMTLVFYRMWHGVDAQLAQVKAAVVDGWLCLPVATMEVAYIS